MENANNIFNIFKAKYEKITEISKVIGKGKNYIIREIKYKNRPYAAKLAKRERNVLLNNYKLFLDIKANNIQNIHNIYTILIDDKYYDLIIEDKAPLRDINKMNEFYHKHDLLKLIYNPFNEVVSDTLLRFYATQIINGLEIIYRNNIIHLNLNLENLLVTIELKITLSSFNNCIKYGEKQIKDNFNLKIPENEKGYHSPEYYINSKMSIEDAKKQDYFALGSSLFLLKFGEKLLDFKKYKELEMNSDRIINVLERRINFIKSQPFINEDLIYFIISLIQYKIKDRFSFEQIYRNKWLNDNKEEINLITKIFIFDEQKLLLEIQKSDYLIKKEKELKDCKISKYKFKKKKKQKKEKKV